MHRCFELEDQNGEHRGYWRQRRNAEIFAEVQRFEPVLLELDPPDPIACEDDPDPADATY